MAVVVLQVCRKSDASCIYLNSKASPIILFQYFDLGVHCYQGFELFALPTVFISVRFSHVFLIFSSSANEQLASQN